MHGLLQVSNNLLVHIHIMLCLMGHTLHTMYVQPKRKEKYSLCLRAWTTNRLSP